MKTYGERLVAVHLAEMGGLSRLEWPPIVEKDGYRIIDDMPYQGFDNDGSGPAHPWWPERRFWCRSITVERLADGARAWGIGPQAEAYEMAVRRIEEDCE